MPEKKQTFNLRLLLLGLVLLLLPQICRADTGVMGLLIFFGPAFALVSFFGVIAIETGAIRKMLLGSSRKAFFVSLLVNFITALAGVLAWWILERLGVLRGDETFIALFGGGFIFSLIAETLILRFYYQKDKWSRVLITSLIMNISSYAFLAVLVIADLFIFPTFIVVPLVLVYFSHILLKTLIPDKKISVRKRILFYLIAILIAGIFIGLAFLSLQNRERAPRPSRIVGAIGQARTVMTYIGSQEGSYDNVNCFHPEMEPLCEEVERNGGLLIFQRAPAINSTSACMYSLYWEWEFENHWYCADSEGYAGATTTDPSRAGCSLEGGARCPAGLVNP